ncbi:NIPSNAP family protein [Falsiroseomonas selenitidurans]|uniref:NIPSNAP family protein n=1 Tax=Falsiroseomonas selenitidurans TaxID=2716335 RepID=A0ABX1EAN8_9PROT|nr:NIPSNAP family protein [Falsiroseomonas selenitidurans]NKC33891.1 NIPSNAP family protein [Falsiroseomonas selenitidurans]
MLHEYRTYTIHPAQLGAYVRLANQKAIPIRGDDYGRLLGFWVSEAGTLCQVHHIWEYASLDARQAERARMWTNDRWREEFIAFAWPTMQVQEVRFMTARATLVAPAGPQALYEARVYQTVVGRFVEAALAVQKRPLSPGATRVGCWTCESPQPNQVVEIVAYADANLRFVADESQASEQASWWDAQEADLLGASATIMRPIAVSPLK